MIIEKASNKELELLKDAHFKHPENIRASLDHDAIAHILKRHGANSVNVRNGEIPITNEDIANYRYIVNNADAILRTLDKDSKEAITAFKQINGYAVVVEQAINKKNELALKTMYKNNGSYKNNEVYKEFSSTSLDADAKVRHRLSSYSGATENTTQKPLTDQEDLLKTQENTQKNQDLSPLEQAEAEKLAKLQHAITPLKEFGTNYPEFALKPKEALEKLLQEKNGQVAGAAFRDDLGGIDFVWGNKDYGLEHILKRREQQALNNGLNEAEAKEYALNVVKSIPEIIEKGVKVDNNGRIAIEYKHMRVGLNDKWDNQKLENKWVISSYEIYNSESGLPFRPIAQLQEVGLEPSKLTGPHPTTNAHKSQTPLSPLEQANAEKLAKLQHAITPLKEFGTNYPEFALKPKEALEKLLQEKNGQVAGAAFRDDLGGIDFVWGKDGKSGYGLAHIIESREKQYTRLGLNAEQIKERTDELLKSIPEVIENGTLFTDDLGRVSVELNDVKVGLTNRWFGNDLKNHLIVTSYEKNEKVLRELETRSPLSNDYKGNSNYSALNLNEPNLTPKPLTSQEDLLKTQENPQKTQENTLKIIEELNNGVKQASEEIKEATKPSNLVKSIREQDTRPFEVVEAKDKEAFLQGIEEKLKDSATPLPKGMSVEEFKQSLESVENKDRFLEHLETRDNSQDRLKFLSLIEPIIREPHIEIFIKDKDGTIKKEYIKAFKDEDKTRLYMLITQDNDTILRTFIPKLNERYMRNHVRNADIIHSFIQPNRTAKSDNALSDVVVYGDNPTQKPLTDQEDLLKTSENLNETTQKSTQTPLSPLEQANAEKLAKLESEKLESEKEFSRLKEQEQQRKEALKKKLEHERGNAGNIESATKIEVGEDIPTHTQTQIPKSRVRLNEREIYDLDYAIVKAKDLKPSFTTGGTQKRTDMNEEQIKSIAKNFDPKKIFGSGGFEDLPIILHDGQVIAGNHRVQGMLNFTPKSRFAYERAIKEYYHIDLKPDELLVRVPHNRLNNTEINNLAASSNQGRFNSESDHAIAVLSHYEPKLKELETKLNADSIYSLKNIVAKNLNFDKATHPNVGDSNLALLMFNMPRTKTQGIELLNRWQKEFSNDIKSYEKVKKMFVDNAGSFHNLIHDMNFPNVSLNAYLSDIMDRSFANLKNYQSTSESLQSLSEKFYKTSSLDMFEKSDQSTSDISEILGGAIARFARFDDPSKALFEALKSDNIKKGLKEFKIADVTKDMFNPDSKEFKDIDIYDFTHYLLMVNREPNETNPTLKRLIKAVKDMQKESEKGIKAKAVKKLNFDEIKKLIDESPRTGSSMPILGMQNLNAEAVEYIQKNHKRIAIEKIEPSFAKDLKLKYPDDARAVIDYQAINHILKEHKNLSFEDIANYRELSKQANETLKLKDNQNRPVVASFNQINGFFVVVEQVSNAKNELMLKTMYKARGNYKDSLIYKKTLAKSQNSN